MTETNAQTLARLRAERRALVEKLIRHLDNLAATQARGAESASGYARLLAERKWGARDLDAIEVLGDRVIASVEGSDKAIDGLAAEIRAISAAIKLVKANQSIDPPAPIGPGEPTDPPTGGGRPGEGLDWGVKEKPTAADMDWVCENNVLRSQRGLGETTSWGDAYRASRAAGVVNPHFGILGRVNSEVLVGGKWGGGDSELLDPGDDEASATFLGMNDNASARIAWGSHFGNAQPTGEIAVFDCGVQGRPDGHMMNAKKGARHCQVDGAWLVHHDSDFDYQAGLDRWHWAHSISYGPTDVLVVRNQKWRGEQPTDPGLRFLYYSVGYFHGQQTSFLFGSNDCRGGGRGGMQNRPDNWRYDGAERDPRPAARVMLRGNHYRAGSNDYGDGGQCMGIWSALGGLYVYDNDCEEFPFTALMTSGQATASNYPTDSGNQIAFCHMAGNRFAPGPDTRRATVSMSSIDELHIYGNDVAGPCAFDAKWNWERNGTMIGAIRVHSDAVPEWMRGADHYDIGKGKTVKYTDAELRAMLVEVPAP